MDLDFLLIRKMKQGDDEAFELFIHKYYKDILSYCKYHCADKGYAEDLTQETFIRFFTKLSFYHHKGKMKNYLYTIANNLCILHSMDNMRAALKDSLERQWQIEQEKNRQMSALAHDLKTPLTLVRGNAELLLESDLSVTQKKYTEYIESSSLQMQNYVQTLIEVTKSLQGYQFRPQKIKCEFLFREIEQQLKGLCTVHHLTPVWDCQYTVSEISVDHDLLIRAVVNVISNAAERTPAGGKIVFSVSEENNFLLFAVTDTGSGFSPESLKHGAEQFYMDDTSRSSKTHFGIGLYAANSIIQKHGGQLILGNSKETGGAKVTIKIPF